MRGEGVVRIVNRVEIASYQEVMLASYRVYVLID